MESVEWEYQIGRFDICKGQTSKNITVYFLTEKGYKYLFSFKWF